MTTQAQALDAAAKFLRDLRNRRSTATIDVEVEWPPPDEGVHLSACTGMLIHGERPTRVAEHFLDSVAWDRRHIDSEEMLGLLATLGQRGPRRSTGGPNVYLRVHDSASSVSVATREQILGRKRPDRVPPPRRPIPNAPGSPPADPREGHELHRGDRLSVVAPLLGVAARETTEVLANLLALGMRVGLGPDKETISHVAYIRPYPRKVCGVWLGASVSDVHAIHGAPADEMSMGRGDRTWIYDHDGHMCVGFDASDCVAVVIR